jgi:PadR family transcriptional regulator AphA
MSLPHVLLGLLSDQPRTGYELERLMREELDSVWRAEFSQIYPALARLRRAGFVVLRVLGPRRGPSRNLFRATAAGRRELKSWILEPSSALRGRDEILARLAFSDALTPAERREAIARHEQAIAEEIARLKAAPMPKGSRREARRGALEKLEAMRRWLRLSAHESMTPAVPAPAPRPAIHKKR